MSGNDSSSSTIHLKPASSGNGAPGKDASEVAAIPARIVAAWADNDAEAFAAVFTDDATMLLPGDVFRKGRAEVQEYMAAGYAGPYRGTRVAGEPISLRFISPGVAVLVTEGGVLAPGETEVAAQRLIRATWVVAKQPSGEWLLAAYHNSPVHVG